VPTPEPTVRVTIDEDERYQTLVGFGASLAYAEGAIVASSDKEALYDFVFEDSGLDVVRVRNGFADGSDTDLSAQSEVLAAAAQRLGRAPLLFMTSGSAPANLKASGMLSCEGDAETCTLRKLMDGSFDYDGFAAYWRGSLEGYADEGISPDYISIQNDPDWLPTAEEPHEACRFLPEEGTVTETVDGAEVDIDLPGYREALAAVRAAIADLPEVPKIGAPEASDLGTVGPFAEVLDAADLDALCVHLYDIDAQDVDEAPFTAARELGEQWARPVFQTEMQAGGFETAVLAHHALADANASAYLQNDLVAMMPNIAPFALVSLTSDGFEAKGAYYALAHFAQSTDPGFVRVGASTDSSDVLATAWVAPGDDALTLVLVNTADEDRDVEIALPEELRSRLPRVRVTRTVFEGIERLAALGELPESGIVRLPAQSILTVALSAR